MRRRRAVERGSWLQFRRVSATVAVQVPSQRVPTTAAFEIAVPASWTPRPAPGVLVSFEVGGHPDWSVVVSTLRIGSTSGLRDVAVRSFARQRAQRPSATIRTQRTGRFDGRLTYLREVVVPEDGAALAQLHALFTVPLAGEEELADVFSVVATCPDGELDALGPSVIDLVASFRTIGG